MLVIEGLGLMRLHSQQGLSVKKPHANSHEVDKGLEFGIPQNPA